MNTLTNLQSSAPSTAATGSQTVLDPMSGILQAMAVNVRDSEVSRVADVETALKNWESKQIGYMPFVTIPDSTSFFSLGVADKMKWPSAAVVGTSDANVLNGKNAPASLRKAFSLVFAEEQLNNAMALHQHLMRVAYKTHSKPMDGIVGSLETRNGVKVPENETQKFWFGNNNSTGIKACHISFISHKDWLKAELGVRDTQNMNLTGAVVVYQLADDLTFNHDKGEDGNQISQTNHCRTVVLVHLPKVLKDVSGFQFGFGSQINSMTGYLRAMRLCGANFESTCQSWNSVAGLGEAVPQQTVHVADANFDLMDSTTLPYTENEQLNPLAGSANGVLSHDARADVMVASADKLRKAVKSMIRRGPDPRKMANFKENFITKVRLQSQIDNMTEKELAKQLKKPKFIAAVRTVQSFDKSLAKAMKDKKTRAFCKALKHLYSLETAAKSSDDLKLHPIGAAIFGSAGFRQEELQTFQHDGKVYNPASFYFNEGAMKATSAWGSKQFEPRAQFAVSQCALKPRLTRPIMQDIQRSGWNPQPFSAQVGASDIEGLQKQAEQLSSSLVYMHNGGFRALSDLYTTAEMKKSSLQNLGEVSIDKPLFTKPQLIVNTQPSGPLNASSRI
ncbi:MAG: uncharacterized protein KVP18_002725 [Porospora cf. gigantea A]|uniref:uncharacterized protein n=1 Tax=Porospora cf. gigantea A TaxID=2853593 RepID=UPI003559B598|nr:MAG: hypothetical protein KVP18_002725 [Porospora cf. gigantea A]